MKQLLSITAVLIALTGCTQPSSKKQQATYKKHVGGSCEGCEAIYETPVPFDQLSFTDTLPDFNEQGEKIEVSGIVYQRDGKTPAKDVVIYVYHTDQAGHYSTKGNETGWGRRHGYIRGWMKTNSEGRYTFYTLRPASYPNSKNPQHIHVIIKEPDKNEYWIDEYLFADDPFLKYEKNNGKPRGSNGVLQLKKEVAISHATRHIILGLNIEDYPEAGLNKKIKSGLAVGSNCPAFDPLHLSGADAGKSACPMCKYGYGQGVMVWFNHTNLDQLKDFVMRMEREMNEGGEKKLRVFMVYMNPSYKQNDETGQKILQEKIKKWCADQNLQKVAIVWIPSPVDEETAGLYKINPEVENTVFVYKKRKIAAKWVNINYDDETLSSILHTL